MQRILFGILSMVSLALCLVFSIVYFLGKIKADRFKSGFLFASIAWFIFATLWATRAKKSSKT
jgi:EamA domain-containing membrane protein RarD